MRLRPQPRSTQNRRRQLEAFAAPEITIPAARIFNPSELDLDDLAEAIRSLLGSGSIPQTTSLGGPNPALLLLPSRGSHVVEANETH